jgi:RNA polymerase sigma-70 factor (ECF subfamily)
MRALDGLPEDQRAVLLLVAVEDLSYAQAATALDIPVGTVMSRLARARQRLHRMLDGVDAMPAAGPTTTGPSAHPHLRRLK